MSRENKSSHEDVKDIIKGAIGSALGAVLLKLIDYILTLFK